MKVLQLSALLALLTISACESPVSKQPLAFHNWPPKSSKQVALGRNPMGKQRTLVVQIRSDQPVPLVLQGRPNHLHSLPHTHAHLHAHPHAHLHHGHGYVRGSRPLKLTGPIYLKTPSGSGVKSLMRKPLKLKLANLKLKSKPASTYEKPFKYETPNTVSFAQLTGEVQKLPLESHASFVSDSFAAIHTIPAPNLALHDNHLHPDESYLPPKPQPYHQLQSTNSNNKNNNNQYQVIEENTNDQTILDPVSGSQKLFAPDPDPSLPTSKIRPVSEQFNQPSNGKPLPVDVQSNFLPAAQPLVQIVSGQQQQQLSQPIPEIYPIQYSQAAQLQPFVAVSAASIPIYNPTYLVTQSNNLYTQHKQQLFKPNPDPIVEAGYVNADLTQEVASNGQILQAARDPHNNIHPVLDSAPQFAALIAAPALSEEIAYERSPFRLPNVAAETNGAEGGFVVSNYYSSPQDSSQLLQAYAEEEAQRQQAEAHQAAVELQQHQQHQQLQLQQQQEEQQFAQLLELQQQHYNEQQQQQLQFQQPQALHQQHYEQHIGPDVYADEQQHLLQQPLRIFVPDEEPRLQKRADKFKKGSVEEADTSADADDAEENDSFEVFSSVEVSNNRNRDDNGHGDRGE